MNLPAQVTAKGRVMLRKIVIAGLAAAALSATALPQAGAADRSSAFEACSDGLVCFFKPGDQIVHSKTNGCYPLERAPWTRAVNYSTENQKVFVNSDCSGDWRYLWARGGTSTDIQIRSFSHT
jgi:hypothetical protein